MERFLHEVISKPLIINEQGMDALELIVRNIFTGKQTDNKVSKLILHCVNSDKGETTLSFSNDLQDADTGNPFDQLNDNSIAIIPLVGMMKKYSGWFSNGTDEIANYIRMASASDKITGIVMPVNSPGGTVASIYQLEDALRNNTKPIVGLIDGQAASGAQYAISFCDKILAMNRMCQCGNIGTMMSMVNTSKADKQYGYERITVYPPESSYKNLAFREAMDGNTKRLIDEELSPWATHFQNIIKSNRPNIDTSVEGILNGRDFYAYDAKKNGLIDGLGNMNDAIDMATKMANERTTLYSQFKIN